MPALDGFRGVYVKQFWMPSVKPRPITISGIDVSLKAAETLSGPTAEKVV